MFHPIISDTEMTTFYSKVVFNDHHHAALAALIKSTVNFWNRFELRPDAASASQVLSQELIEFKQACDALRGEGGSGQFGARLEAAEELVDALVCLTGLFLVSGGQPSDILFAVENVIAKNNAKTPEKYEKVTYPDGTFKIQRKGRGTSDFVEAE